MARDPSKSDCGFQPEALDPVLLNAIDRLGKVVVDVERIRGALEPHLDEIRTRLVAALQTGNVADATLLASAERLIEFLEKYARTALNLTKVTDEAARLRSFVAGGADSRPDLAGLSESELSKIVLDAAGKSGA